MEKFIIYHRQTLPQFNLVKGNYLFKVLKEPNCSQRQSQLPATEATAPCRACFTPEKVPFFKKLLIFYWEILCDLVKIGPFDAFCPPKWTFLKKRPCGWLPLNHLGFIDYYTNITQGWLSGREITCTYIPLTILRATGLKWFKVM